MKKKKDNVITANYLEKIPMRRKRLRGARMKKEL